MTSDVIDQLEENIGASSLGSEVSDELISILRGDPDAKKDWERVTLSDVAEIVGRGITPKYNEIEGLLVINQRCIRDGRIVIENARRHDVELKSVTSPKYLKPNDIIVNSTGVGTLGRTAFVDSIIEPMTVDTHVTIVRPRSMVDPKWLKCFISSSEGIIEDMAEGSTGQTELKREKLGALEIDLPPLHIQKQIADLLSVFDEKIELLRAQNKTLESIAQAIYRHWFVDFEFPMPEEDASALGKSELTGQPYKSSGGKMKPSELGDIPESFSTCPFIANAEILSGGTPKTDIPEYWDGDIPWASVRDFDSATGWTLKTEKYISEEGLKSCSSVLLNIGDSIISARGTVGEVTRVAVRSAFNQSCYGIRAKSENDQQLLYFQLLSIVNKLDSMAYGAVFDTITRETFNTVSVCYPNDMAIGSFNHIADPIASKSLQNAFDLEKCRKAKNALSMKVLQ